MPVPVVSRPIVFDSVENLPDTARRHSSLRRAGTIESADCSREGNTTQITKTTTSFSRHVSLQYCIDVFAFDNVLPLDNQAACMLSDFIVMLRFFGDSLLLVIDGQGFRWQNLH